MGRQSMPCYTMLVLALMHGSQQQPAPLKAPPSSRGCPHESEWRELTDLKTDLVHTHIPQHPTEVQPANPPAQASQSVTQTPLYSSVPEHHLRAPAPIPQRHTNCQHPGGTSSLGREHAACLQGLCRAGSGPATSAKGKGAIQPNRPLTWIGGAGMDPE